MTKPKPLTPRQLLRGDMPGVLSQWRYAHANPVLEQRVARELLALWAGMQRLAIEALDEIEQRLDALVQTETATLARAVLQTPLFDADDWIRRAEKLDRAWEEGEEEDELDWRAYQLFGDLDGAGLALWALRKLLSAEVAPPPGTIDEELERARRFLAERVDLFLGLATDVAAVLSDSRRGLEETDFDLWETLLPHRRIEETRDEMEVLPTRGELERQQLVSEEPPKDDRDPVTCVGTSKHPSTGCCNSTAATGAGNVAF